MAFIQTVPEDAADGDVAEMYESDRAGLGYVTNYTKAFSLRPPVMRAWVGLAGAIKAGMELRTYELATVAAARQLRSSYCSLAHGKILAEQVLDGPDQAREAFVDPASSGLRPVDVAVMNLAGKVAADATSVTEDDVQRLRDLGCSDTDILDVILAASVRCFFSKVLDATGSLADSTFRSLDPALRDALTVGRPIAEAQ
jgi:uncharacterized peroxidase-related enzyme